MHQALLWVNTQALGRNGTSGHDIMGALEPRPIRLAGRVE